MTIAHDARVDLHVHTTASDGAYAPAAVVEAAIAGGLDVLAIADHDTTGGLAEAQAAARGRIHLIPAVEVSTSHDGRDVHILGYHIDPYDTALASFAERAIARRRERAGTIVEKLNALGVQIEIGDVVRLAGSADGSAIGRPHVARALVANGQVRSVSEAFDRWLADDQPAFVPTHVTTPTEAVALIKGAGGTAVWAHPSLEAIATGIDALCEAGIEGLEVYRPRLEPRHMRRVRKAADARGLFVTGGSDWHGDWHGPLGVFAVPAVQVETLLGLGQTTVAPDPAA